jgi:hypothetical protein
MRAKTSNYKLRFSILTCLSLILVIALLGLMPVAVHAGQPQVTCVAHKHVTNWTNTFQLQAHDFFVEVFSPEAGLSFQQDGFKFLALNVAATPQFNGQYVASRITEIDTSVSPIERVKCWQPDAGHTVVAEYTLRFDQQAAPPGLTENLILWNAPFGQDAIPLTAVGVTRSLDLATGQPAYSALVAQDLDFATFSGLLRTAPMPAWLDASDWHTVRVTETQQDVLIEISQGSHPYTTVLQVTFLHAPEALGFEASVDNEVLPGLFAPITVPDGVDLYQLDIRMNP